ncbi:unnamed protein product [Nezara viridula]|uniref:Uncharacterized protein n=1 Tax=Nezara viridula TaxID=85310 RepID=A0A9P0H1W5_NEZVI|nr:unnamed protein product [Nezara viridula]
MGSGQSCGAGDNEKTTITKSKSYVEELLHIKQANFLNSNSVESKEEIQSRRERILKALTDRKPVKPYAVQLLEARAANKSELSIPETFQAPIVNTDAQSKRLQGQKNVKESDQKSRILQRIAARRKSKRPVNNTSLSPTVRCSSATAARGPSATDINALPISTNTSPVRTNRPPAAKTPPPPTVYSSTPPASNKATQYDPPAKVSFLSRASQSSSLGSSVDSAIQVTPTVQSSLQQTVRLSEPKIYVQPSAPPPPKILPPPPKILSPPPMRLSIQPPLSVRQSISAAFSRPSPSSALDYSIAPSPPSFSDLLENVCKDKLNQNKPSNWRPASLMEQKKRYFDQDPVPLISSPIKSISGQKLLTIGEKQPLDFDSDVSYRKRHTAAVDRITDSLMANWVRKKTSAELLGADEKELSLLTYSESKRPEVPHFPVRGKGHINQECSNHGDALALKASLPSVRFGKSRHSLLRCESRSEKRCIKHQDNKNLI